MKIKVIFKNPKRNPAPECYCSRCGHRVGGYNDTGSGDNDWGYFRQKFCSKCGAELDYEGFKEAHITSYC